MDQTAPLILTLRLDERSFAFFDGQRRRYFPSERNFIPAHLTLFHKLPGEKMGDLCRDLGATSRQSAPIPLSVTGLRFLGRGVAYTLHSPFVSILRAELAERWSAWLEPQDRQRFQPHVTVQNKVEPEAARALQAELTGTFVPFPVTGAGLDLWWYRGGPWEKAQSFPFTDDPPLPPAQERLDRS